VKENTFKNRLTAKQQYQTGAEESWHVKLAHPSSY
jgi:hypothetical protein